VAKGIGLRKQIAELLGFKSWAHYITAGRMAGSLEAVNDFSDDIDKLVRLLSVPACASHKRAAPDAPPSLAQRRAANRC